MKPAIILLTLGALAILWFTGDESLHVQATGQDTILRHFGYVAAVGVFGLFFGYGFDRPSGVQSIGPAQQSSGIVGVGRWLTRAVPFTLCAAGAGLLVEYFVRDVRSMEQLTLFTLWHTSGAFAAMLTLLRFPASSASASAHVHSADSARKAA